MDSINTDEFEEEEEDYLRIQMGDNRTLNNNHVVGYVSTNMDESWEYNIWIRNISQDLDLDGDGEPEYTAGEREVGEESGMDLVNHSLSMQGNNGYITIEKLFEFYPEGLVVEFILEVKNTEFQLLEHFDQLGTSEEETEPVLGDVNGDGILNVLDIVQTVQHILAETSDEIIDLADMNQDGSVNVLDAVIMVNIVLGD